MLYQVHTFITLLLSPESDSGDNSHQELSETGSTADLFSLAGETSLSLGKPKLFSVHIYLYYVMF